LQILHPTQRSERDRASISRWASYAHRRPICSELHWHRRIASHILELVGFFLSSCDGSADKKINQLSINFNGPAQLQTPGFANTNCPNGLRAQIFFPGCWDGMNLDSSDHKSHMAYPDGIDNGYCPSSHPVHLISIFYEVWFNVAPFNQLNDGGRFVLANGDSTGYGLHGDFLNGWDQSVLSRAVQACTDGSGELQNCPVFQNEGRIQTNDQMNSCPSAPNPLPSENISGPMQYLPGCVPVTNGPAPATPGALAPGCTPASRRRSPDAEFAPRVNRRRRRHRAMRGQDYLLTI
jgi:hypothetical protein